MTVHSTVKRVTFAVAGGALLLGGLALLVLPGPGLLLVVAGLMMLSSAFPRLERRLEPVRRRAMRAVEESVSSPWRVAGAVLTALALIGAGVAWGLVPRLPEAGWPTGAALMLSGAVLLALLAYSYRRARTGRGR